jgi:hypothetical protein
MVVMDFNFSVKDRNRMREYFSWPKEFRVMLKKLEEFQDLFPSESSSGSKADSRVKAAPALKTQKRGRRSVRSRTDWSELMPDGTTRRESLYKNFALIHEKYSTLPRCEAASLSQVYRCTVIAINTQYQTWRKLNVA